MALDFDIVKGTGAICKYIYKHPNTHKNIVRKELIKAGKFKNNAEFDRLLTSLIAIGKVKMGTREQISLNQEISQTGIIQKQGEDFYIVTPASNKHIKLRKSIVSGYEVGDIVDILVEHSGREKDVFILGKSQNAFVRKYYEEQLSLSRPKLSKGNSSALQPQSISHETTQHKSNSTQPSKGPSPHSNATIKSPTYEPLLAQELLLGRVVKMDHDELVFIPNDKSIVPRHIPILNAREELASFENKICVMNIKNINSPSLGGDIVQVKGDAGNPIHEYEAIAEMVGAITSWNSEELRTEIAQIPTKVDLSKFSLVSEEQATKNHRGHLADLRSLPFCATDPEGARDKDDAIYSTYDEDGNIVVYTAIANVPRYVDVDSEIARKYFNSVFTFYASNRAYGVLPPELSTGICSLTPGEDRLAFVVKRTINKETGEVMSSHFFDAVINCKKSYTYEEAQEIVDSFGGDDLRTHFEWKILTGEPLTSDEQVLMDHYSAQVLKAIFEKRQMLRFNSNKQYKPKFDSAQTTVLDIEKVRHLSYNEVIEFFMITANEASAEFAKEHNIDSIFRVHDEPSTRKADRANEFFDLLNIDFDGNLSADGIRSLITLVKDTPAEEFVNQFLIKMQSRAEYSAQAIKARKSAKGDHQKHDWYEDAFEPISHFALQSKGYSHTTAPIRRATDFIVIYNIMAYIHGTKPLPKEVISSVIERANEMQKLLDEGEKAIASINGVLYAENHIGEQMKGRISKLRYTSPEEGYKDQIVAVVMNDDKGICAEVPISQITGKNSFNYSLSPHGNAVVDYNGNVVIKIYQPLEFIIERADRKTMNVVGKTNKQLASEINASRHGAQNNKSHLTKSGKNKKKVKHYQPNKPKNKKHNPHNHAHMSKYDEYGLGDE